ncbi:MAG TPA: hypothetical protein VM370_13475 [Candidatus Thermoplasmatota archaeon]|nr:hypothetical protein [Candidatus Thermoplasmatota archaeon]
MKDRKKRWARLLPDYRTLYLSLDEMDDRREPGETDADVLLRSLRYAEDAVDADGRCRLLAHEIVLRAGLPAHDQLGVQLAMALVARGHFLGEHPHLRLTIQDGSDEEDDARPQPVFARHLGSADDDGSGPGDA